MSVDTQLQAMRDNISAAYTTVATKGGSVPTNKNLASLNASILSIQSILPNGTARYKITNNDTIEVIDTLPSEFVNLTRLTNVCSYCYNSTNISGNITFPNLTTILSKGGQGLFARTHITNVYFPVFNQGGDNCCERMFQSCEQLISATYNALTTAGSRCFYLTFSGCIALTSANFPLLASAGYYCFNNCFANCTALASISFPSLTTIDNTAFTNAFSGCTNLIAIHFKASAQSVVESLSGYSSKWGASNATIYFDL